MQGFLRVPYHVVHVTMPPMFQWMIAWMITEGATVSSETETESDAMMMLGCGDGMGAAPGYWY